jgi:hypothetical protein
MIFNSCCLIVPNVSQKNDVKKNVKVNHNGNISRKKSTSKRQMSANKSYVKSHDLTLDILHYIISIKNFSKYCLKDNLEKKLNWKFNWHIRRSSVVTENYQTKIKGCYNFYWLWRQIVVFTLPKRQTWTSKSVIFWDYVKSHHHVKMCKKIT